MNRKKLDRFNFDYFFQTGFSGLRRSSAGMVITFTGYCASALGFVFWAIVSNRLSLVDVGQIMSLTALLPLVITTGNFGVSDTILRFFRENFSSWQFFQRLAVRAVSITILITAVATLVLSKTTLGGSISGWEYALWFCLPILQICAVLLGTCSVALERPQYNLMAVLLSGLSKILIVWLVSFAERAAILVLFALVAASVVEIFVLAFSLRSQWSQSPEITSKQNVNRYSIANWASSSISLLTTSFIPFLLMEFTGAANAATIAIPLLFFGAMTLPVASMARSYLATAAARPDEARETLRISISMAIIIAVALTVTLSIGAPLVMNIFGPNYGEESAMYIRGFAVVAMLTIPNYFIDAYVNFRKWNGAFAVINIGGAIVNTLIIAATIIFAPSCLVLGMGIGQLLYTTLAVTSIWTVVRRHRRIADDG